jgi:hypothetical protein
MNIGHLIWMNPNLDFIILVNFKKLLYLFSFFIIVNFILLKIVRVCLWTIFKKFMLNGPNEYSLIFRVKCSFNILF